MNFIGAIVIACAMIVAGGPPQARGWRGIVPLRSTRADVERLLGVPKETRGVVSTYDTKDERIDVFYSDGVCGVGAAAGWKVPRDTVVSLKVQPNAKLLVDDLKLDKTKYERQRDTHLENVVYYISRAEGVFIGAWVMEGGVEDVYSITHQPAAADDGLRCPGWPPATGENENPFDPHIQRFDAYPDLPPKDEAARLDNLALHLLQEMKTKAYIIAYAGRRARPGEAMARAERARDYLTNKRGVEAWRVITIDGGYREKLEVDIYVVPRDMAAPTPHPTVEPGEVQFTKSNNCKS